MDAKDLLEKYQKQIEQSLGKILPRKYTKESLEAVIGKVNYELDIEAINKAINEPIWNFMDRGGKRIRPVLFLIILEIFHKNPADFIDLAASLEFIHNGTLVVDDIEDSSQKRRGKPTLHLIYGEDIAINAGNTLYFLPLLAVLKNLKDQLSEEKVNKIIFIYLEIMTGLSIGQAEDISWHKGMGKNINDTKYFQMCTLKSGGLFKAAFQIAATVGSDDQFLIEKFGKLGETLGLVYQIQDDILNITENELSAGKGIGDDITEGKRSLPVIYALHNLPKGEANKLNEILLMHTTEEKLINEAIELIKLGQGIEKAQGKMGQLFDEAWGELEPLLTAGERRDKLHRLAKFLIDRSI